MEDDDLGARRLRDSRRMIEHADRHVQLLAALRVAHEAGDRRVHREHDAVVAREVAEARREVVVHPEAALEVDLARGIAAREQELDRSLGRFLRGHARRPETDLRHARRLCRPTSLLHSSAMSKRPSRIDLLELDIDLRLADLWREAAEIGEWNLDVVA